MMKFSTALPLTKFTTPKSSFSTTNTPKSFFPSLRVVPRTAVRSVSSKIDGTDKIYEQPLFDKSKLNLHSPDESKRAMSYFLIGAVGLTYAISAKAIALTFIDSMNPAKDVLAMANVEVDLSNVPVGENIVVKWRGKPLFIRRRSEEEIAEATQDDNADLKDPQADAKRVKDPEWLIVLGVCTHLGCVPIAKSGDFGGYFCPCHGSHYDTSGRIRKGPAPANLEVPPYVFLSDSKVLIGVNSVE